MRENRLSCARMRSAGSGGDQVEQSEAFQNKEFRIFGPPGTGKTTFVSKWIGQAAEKYGPEKIIVGSFTRAAAAELVGRKLPLKKDQVGTLHSHCYRILGGERPIAELHVKEWNEAHPALALSIDGADLDDEIEGTFNTEADRIFSQLQILRAKMIPSDLWPSQVLAFSEAWEVWKGEGDLIDFTDMIDIVRRDFWHIVPGEASIGFFDEAQDFTPLELSLVRSWASWMDFVVLAGDDDQSIYSFKGASPDALLTPLPEDQIRILAQSYRVPRLVQQYSTKWIEQIRRRQPKQYAARDFDGELRRFERGSYRNVGPLLLDAEKYLAAGKSVMFLGACSYMLDPIKQELRRIGIPFHNPFRRKRGDWNPLVAGSGTSAAMKLLNYLRPSPLYWQDKARLWTFDEFRSWASQIKAEGNFYRGAKARLEKEKGYNVPDFKESDVDVFLPAMLMQYFDDDAVAEILQYRPEWLREQAAPQFAKSLEFPLRVLNKRGVDALRDPPKVIIGTIHSVKGGEADVVYLFPDVSPDGFREWMTPGDPRDNILRQFYVGFTRARESLILCGAAGGYKVQF